VDVPYTPPPNPEAVRPPEFQEIKRFREQFGLDLDIGADKLAINERIFELINACNDPNSYLGEVARATTEQWGVPLRPVDVDELEYCERYLEQDGPLIERWAREPHPGTFAGYQLDDQAGGKLRIGFTQDQSQAVAEFVAKENPVAADRSTTFASVPTQPLATIEATEASVLAKVEEDAQLRNYVASIESPEVGNVVEVQATNPQVVESILRESLGSLNGISVTFVPGFAEPLLSRERKGGRMMAGDRLFTDWRPSEAALVTAATANFGAQETVFLAAEKRYVQRPFVLSAGHTGNVVFGSNSATPIYGETGASGKTSQWKREHGEKVGLVARNALTEGTGAVDALAARLLAPDLMPVNIAGDGAVGPAGVAHKHEMVCMTGSTTERTICGRVTGFGWVKVPEYPNHYLAEIHVKSNSVPIEHGDSGGPVWAKYTHESLGIVSTKNKDHPLEWNATPLLNTDYGNGKQLPGALNAAVMGGGSLDIVSDR